MNNAKKSNAKKSRVTFEIAAETGAQVFIAGSFNEWTPQASLVDKDGNGIYRCTLMLEPGSYEYKFKVNDSWLLDNNNPNFTKNAFGSLNSVVNIPKDCLS